MIGKAELTTTSFKYEIWAHIVITKMIRLMCEFLSPDSAVQKNVLHICSFTYFSMYV